MTTPTSVGIAEGPLGANRLPRGEWEFLFWAPHTRRASIQLVEPTKQNVEMARVETGGEDRGYFSAVIDADEGARYLYRLDGSRELPDPASRFQPEGDHVPAHLLHPRPFECTANVLTARHLEARHVTDP